MKLIFALSLSLLWTASAAAQNNASTWHPVVVTSHHGELDPLSRRLLVETFSRAWQEGMLVALGQKYYGTGPGFRAGSRQEGRFALWIASQRAMGQALEKAYQEIREELRAPEGEKAWVQVDLFWSQRQLSDEPLRMHENLWGFLRTLFVSSKNHPFAIGETADEPLAYWVSEESIPGGLSALYAEVPQFYDTLTERGSVWFPLHIAARLGIDQDKSLWQDLTVSLRPDGFRQGPSSQTEGGQDFEIESLRYLPQDNFRAVVQLQHRSELRGERAAEFASNLKVRFGEFNRHLDRLIHCLGDGCIRSVDRVPTVSIQLKGSFFKNLLAKQLSLYRFKFLISALSIDLETFRVVPQRSELPVLVRRIDGRWKAIDQNRSQGLNVLTVLQKQLIGDQVSAGIDKRMQKVAGQLERQLEDFLMPIKDWFRISLQEKATRESRP